ncbi:2-hydroxy-palmitic acid dioxygenase MPO1-like [Curcuma longa]|uniref:2-hydroxy-palmitic acid dioxygenase MPO1-like n=1 Tax=Curcuma longa TaxID=136217 RepID=UPI003D9E02BC
MSKCQRQRLPCFSLVPKDLLDLEKHFAFYEAFHSNPANVVIHSLFAWPIFYTSLILFHFTTPIFFLDLGFVFVVMIGLFYVSMDRKAGSLAALLCVLCWIGSGCLASQLGFSLAWKVVLAAQLLCWTALILGHLLFEKRAPALLDNLMETLLTAPFFVLLEVLKNICGYEPYPGFHASVKVKFEDV